MWSVLRLLADIGDRLLHTDVHVPEPIPADPPYDIPAYDWDAAVGAVANRTGATRAAAANGLCDALDILCVLMEADDILIGVAAAP